MAIEPQPITQQVAALDIRIETWEANSIVTVIQSTNESLISHRMAVGTVSRTRERQVAV